MNSWLNTGRNPAWNSPQLYVRRQSNYLPDATVLEIRARWATDKYTIRDLSEEYKRAPSAIWKIVHKKTYTDL